MSFSNKHLNSIPLNQWKVNVTTQLIKQNDKSVLNLVTKVNEEMTKKIIELEEKSVKEALVRLGWTPPNEEKTEELHIQLARTVIEYLTGNTGRTRQDMLDDGLECDVKLFDIAETILMFGKPK